MKIKEVKYNRLFSFGKYENENFGFTVEIEEGEDGDAILGNLYLQVCDIESCLQTFRFLQRQELELNESVEGISADYERNIQDIARVKVRIDEITALIESGKIDSDDRLRHACDRRSFKELNENLKKRQHDLAEAQKELASTGATLKELKTRIKKGQFFLQDLKITKAKYAYYLHYP